MPKAIRQIRVVGNIAYVPLTKGYEAVIDVADVPLVEGFNWFAHVNRNTVYAMRNDRSGPKRHTEYLHRALMCHPDGMEVDHRDGNGLNNTRDNLRVATKSQNRHNQRLAKDNTSGFKGVYWFNARGKWVAQIVLNGRKRHLGYFASPESAGAAYAAASAKLHGEFGRTA